MPPMPVPPLVAADQFGPFDGRVWLNTAHQRRAAAGRSRRDGLEGRDRRRLREGNLRMSLHLFNTAEDVSRALQALHDTTASRS